MPSKFVTQRKLLHSIFRGGDSQGQLGVKSDNVGKENPGYLRHSYIRSDNHNPKKRVGSLETAALSSKRPWLQTWIEACLFWEGTQN